MQKNGGNSEKNMEKNNEKDKFCLNLFWMYGAGNITKEQFMEGIEKIKYDLTEEYDKKEEINKKCKRCGKEIKGFYVINSGRGDIIRNQNICDECKSRIGKNAVEIRNQKRGKNEQQSQRQTKKVSTTNDS